MANLDDFMMWQFSTQHSGGGDGGDEPGNVWIVLIVAIIFILTLIFS